MSEKRFQILLTNDDGILSPGLWAAAEALGTLGYVTVAAPREQSSGAGRSLSLNGDGRIERRNLKVGEQDWVVHAVGGTPATVVVHSLLEILPELPDLVVSGINYGENLSIDITSSGTVGAILEAAAFGIPAMAVSLQLPNVCEDYLSYSEDFNFKIAALFTQKIAARLLERSFPAGINLLNVNVPHDATPETAWRFTRLSRRRYYWPKADRKKDGLSEGGALNSYIEVDPDKLEKDSDVYALIIDKMVSVTPMTLDM
ncbi:MAG: 5'/3'-nucleotidase SurE, partial [Anaerolineaceae bacterium]|nr:5'/3'-nucleotidase SurE [Anaerolineaceae bacterium]